MSEERKPDPESGEPGGGAGRTDRVEKSGVFPATGVDVPADAVVRTPGEWGAGAGGEAGGRSELNLSAEEELRASEADQVDQAPEPTQNE